MDWEHTKKIRAKWVPREEYLKRKEKNLCLRCGSNQHLRPKCPYLGAIPPSSTRKLEDIAPINPILEEDLKDNP